MQQVSGILDVAIGLVFIYLLLSLICTALTEAMEGFLKLRGKMLCEGLFELFGGLTDSKSSAFLNSFYNNPIIYGLYKGDITIDTVRIEGQPAKLNVSNNLPSYIAPNSFALALLNQIVGNAPMSLDSLNLQIAQSPVIPDGVKASLSTLIDTADGKLDKAISNIEAWYTSMGDRVGDRYKRHAQFVAFGMALAIAVAGNVDTVIIAKTLMTDSTLRGQIANLAEQFNTAQATKPEIGDKEQNQLESTQMTDNPKNPNDQGSVNTENKNEQKHLDEITKAQTQELARLADLGLPIGWRNTADQRIVPPCDFLPWLEKLFGWFITTLAVSLGAPFWFDILNRFMNFRATIKPKPVEESKA